MLPPCVYPICRTKVFPLYPFFLSHRLGFIKVMGCYVYRNVELQTLSGRNWGTRSVSSSPTREVWGTPPHRSLNVVCCLDGHGTGTWRQETRSILWVGVEQTDRRVCSDSVFDHDSSPDNGILYGLYTYVEILVLTPSPTLAKSHLRPFSDVTVLVS